MLCGSEQMAAATSHRNSQASPKRDKEARKNGIDTVRFIVEFIFVLSNAAQFLAYSAYKHYNN